MIEIKYSFGSQAFVIHLIAAFDLNFEFFALNKKVTLSIRKKEQKIPVLPTDISTKMIIDSSKYLIYQTFEIQFGNTVRVQYMLHLHKKVQNRPHTLMSI